MHGCPDPSLLLFLVSPPDALGAPAPECRTSGALDYVYGLLSTAADAGVSPTSLLLSALARRDRNLAARARRTAEWARLLAEGVGQADVAQVAHDVALLADIGQLALTPTRAHDPWREWRCRRAAHDLVQAVPSLAHLAQAVLSISERFDGDGLPFGLQGEDIPVTARIARLVRDFDVASQGWWPGRPEAVSTRACMELVSLAGQTVDPALVHGWLRVLDRELAVDVA